MRHNWFAACYHECIYTTSSVSSITLTLAQSDVTIVPESPLAKFIDEARGTFRIHPLSQRRSHFPTLHRENARRTSRTPREDLPLRRHPLGGRAKRAIRRTHKSRYQPALHVLRQGSRCPRRRCPAHWERRRYGRRRTIWFPRAGARWAARGHRGPRGVQGFAACASYELCDFCLYAKCLAGCGADREGQLHGGCGQYGVQHDGFRSSAGLVGLVKLISNVSSFSGTSATRLLAS